jgi:hypothetical protein
VNILKRISGKLKNRLVSGNEEDANVSKIRKLMDLFDRYKAIAAEKVNDELSKEIDSFLSPGIIKIVISPEKYVDGDMLKEIHVKLLELFYAISCGSGKYQTRNKIFSLLYEIYEINPLSIDSLHLQNAYCRHIVSLGSCREDAMISRKIFNILEYSFNADFEKVSNIKTSSEGKKNEFLIVSLQKVIRAIILYGDRNRNYDENQISYTRRMLRTVVHELKYGIFSAQLFNNEYLKLRKTVSGKIIDDFIGDDEKAKFIKIVGSAEMPDLLNYITEHSLPYELGCYFMMTEDNAGKLYKILQSSEIVTDARFRLYALKILSNTKSNEDDIVFHIRNHEKTANSLIRMLTSSDPKASSEEFDKLYKLKQEIKGTPLITGEQRKELAEIAGKIIKGEMYKESKNPFSNNIDAELLMTALVLQGSNIADVDIVKSLKAMPEVLSFNTDSSGKLQEIMSVGIQQDSLLLQDVAADVKNDEKQNLRRFLDIIGLFVTLKSGSVSDIEDIKNEIKKQYGTVDDVDA